MPEQGRGFALYGKKYQIRETLLGNRSESVASPQDNQHYKASAESPLTNLVHVFRRGTRPRSSAMPQEHQTGDLAERHERFTCILPAASKPDTNEKRPPFIPHEPAEIFRE
jgi:hypothetical protein